MAVLPGSPAEWKRQGSPYPRPTSSTRFRGTSLSRESSPTLCSPALIDRKSQGRGRGDAGIGCVGSAQCKRIGSFCHICGCRTAGTGRAASTTQGSANDQQQYETTQDARQYASLSSHADQKESRNRSRTHRNYPSRKGIAARYRCNGLPGDEATSPSLRDA
jgi:hypothetical protein